MLSLSEGGFGVETSARVEQGDSIRLRIQAQGRVPEQEVEAIVWYDRPAPRARGKGEQRLFGCVLPDQPPAFLELFAELERRNAPPGPPLRAERATRPRRPRAEDSDLPRSRDPLPPRKPEPEASLPSFRVRLRQIGGPRTRVVSVRAGSITQAAERVRSDLAESATERWAVLEVTPIADTACVRPDRGD